MGPVDGSASNLSVEQGLLSGLWEATREDLALDSEEKIRKANDWRTDQSLEQNGITAGRLGPISANHSRSILF